LDREKLEGIPGVARISELYPLQLRYADAARKRDAGDAAPAGSGGGRGPGRGPGQGLGPGRRGRQDFRNALVLGAEWLPRFRFVEGTWEEANEAVFSRKACVIAAMLANAGTNALHKGDVLRLESGGGRGGPATVHELEIAGVVDLNWHMVTSRGLVRGLNGAPPMTDGPAFVSLETANALDPRPFLATVPMTHLWVDCDPDFVAEKGVFPAGREIEARIADALGNPVECTVRLHARDEIADGTLAHGDDAIGQAARVPFAFLAILSLGFAAMLVADADAAKRELAVLRAVGATQGQLAWRLARGALRSALAGMAAGVPCGTLCGWLFAVKTAAIWPGMPHPLAVPWRVVAEGACGSLAFVLAVAVPVSAHLVAKARKAGFWSGR
ncbi:MAG: ABC transporter permease, partial [Kiritimatiellae bacterium]|nr:ABC transporter permease [Kiritimatiellia bacterium]